MNGTTNRNGHNVGPNDPPMVNRPGSGWRAWTLCILAAVILSVAATLLLGGDLPFFAGDPEPGCCGSHAACCSNPAGEAGGGR